MGCGASANSIPEYDNPETIPTSPRSQDVTAVSNTETTGTFSSRSTRKDLHDSVDGLGLRPGRDLQDRHNQQTSLAIISLPGEQNEEHLEHTENQIRLKHEEDKRREAERQEQESKKQAALLEVKEHIAKTKTALKERIKLVKTRYDRDVFSLKPVDEGLKNISTLMTGDIDTTNILANRKQHNHEEKRLQSLKKEKVKLMCRLSEIASTRLRANNPNIADLSDQNRATKLGERISELYDNEWTDAFESIDNDLPKKSPISSRDIETMFRDLLEYCYTVNKTLALKQHKAFLHSLTLSPDVNDKKLPRAPELTLRLKEFQKAVSHYCMQYIKQTIRMKIAWSSFQGPKALTAILSKQLGANSKKNTPLVRYMDSCTEVTWYVQMQDPPLVLQFKPCESVPPTYFRAFTSSGPYLDYVLWPAMLLHEGGSVVAKGVAQFCKNEKNAKEDRKNSLGLV